MSVYCSIVRTGRNFLAVALVLITSTLAAALSPERLRCEYLSNPLGIDLAQPRLSWVLRPSSAGARGERQTAYRVLVASTPQLLRDDMGDLWDSGKVSSDETIHIEYSGKPLGSRMGVLLESLRMGSHRPPLAMERPGDVVHGPAR